MALGFQPQTKGVRDDLIGGEAGALGFAEEEMELIERQFDLDGAEHFFLHPGGDVVHAALPFVDGGGAAIAEVIGELLAGESATFAQVA